MNYLRSLILILFLLSTSSLSLASSPYLLGVGVSNGLWTRATLASPWVEVPGSGNVIDVTVMSDGQILGVDKSYGLLVKNSLTTPWKAIPESGNVISACVMSDGKILGVGVSKGLWTKTTLTSPWVAVPASGNIIDVDVMPDGRILGVGNSYGLWLRNSLTSPWVEVPKSGNVISVTVMSDGTIIGVGLSKGLWVKETLTSPWVAVPASGNVIAVTDGQKLQVSPNYHITPIVLNSSTTDPECMDRYDSSSDWYSIQITDPGAIAIKISLKCGDSYLMLYDSSFEELKDAGWGDSTNPPSISTFLNPGTYYIRCKDSGCGCNYTLNVSTVGKHLPFILPLLFKESCPEGEYVTGYDDHGKIVCTSTIKTVFVTNATYNGDLDGIAEANNKCQAAADAAGLNGVYKTWLSDSTSSPSTSFLRSSVPYVTTAGNQIATNWTDLTDGSLMSPINTNEYGNNVGTDVWTNTKADGTLYNVGYSCDNFTSSNLSDRGVVGNTLATDTTWTMAGYHTCDYLGKHHLFCFQQ